MIETGPGFFWNRGLGLGLDNNNLTLVSVESGACAMTRLWLWLAALGTKNVPRAASPEVLSHN